MGPMPSPGGKGRGGPSPGLYDQPDFRIIGGEYGGGVAMGPDVMPDFGATMTAGGGFMGNPDYYSNAGAELGGGVMPSFGGAGAELSLIHISEPTRPY